MSGLNVLHRMTLREIRKNLLQYLAMIIINMLAVTLFCGFISNSLTLEKTLDNYYAQSNLADVICQYSTASPDDKEFLGSLENASVEYRLYAEGSVNQKSAKIYVCESENTISLPVITEGARGVLVDTHVAKRDNLSAGSKIKVEFSERSADFTVTGIMTFAEVASTHTYFPVYIDSQIFTDALSIPAQLSTTAFGSMCNQAVIKTDSPEKIKSAVNAHYSAPENSNLKFCYGRDAMESVILLNGEVTQSLKLIYVFPVIFLLVAVLVVLSTINPLIMRERTNIGTLKGLGVPSSRIVLHYASFGAVLCFIGGIIGIILAPFIVPNVLLIKYILVYSMPRPAGVVFSPLWSAVAVLTTCLLASVVGVVAAYKTARTKPAACMRPAPPKENSLIYRTVSKSGKKETAHKSAARGIALKTAVRNILIKPQRAVMTVIGVMGCVALLVCGFGIGDTVTNSLDLEMGRQFSCDINTAFTAAAQSEFVTEVETLKAENKISHYEIYKTFYMTAAGKSVKDIKVIALPENPQMTTINPEGKTLISKSIAEDLKVSIGGTITLTAAGKSYELIIDEIIETAFTKGIFVSGGEMFEDSYFTYGMWIKAPTADDALIERLNSKNGTGGAYTMVSMRESVEKTISSIDMIKLTMMAFAIALSVVVLYNLSLLNIKERSRDIATLKVLGFSNREIGLSLLIEIMSLVFIGTIFGLMLGYPVTVLVLAINRIEVLTFIYYIKPLSYILSALISLLTALVINLLFTRPIKKINMIESLKSVE